MCYSPKPQTLKFQNNSNTNLNINAVIVNTMALTLKRFHVLPCVDLLQMEDHINPKTP
jgi:hypothetical protein